MKRPVGIFLAGLLVLLLIGLLLIRALAGPESADRAGGVAGLVAGAVAALLSFFPLRRGLRGSNQGFLKAYFGGLVLRFALLALVAAGVWRLTQWNLRAYLTAVALSYPLIMALEGWVLSRELPGRADRGRRA